MKREKYVIRSKEERGYWSNQDGWVFDVASATKFADTEIKSISHLPGRDAVYVAEHQAKDFSDDITAIEQAVSQAWGGSLAPVEFEMVKAVENVIDGGNWIEAKTASERLQFIALTLLDAAKILEEEEKS